MKKKDIQFTIAQFAKLHDVNKRTLHYYDNIGLFSPQKKADNGYRYYTSLQSIDFEFIRMLKELNMSIVEIKDYINDPSDENFINIANIKMIEIENQIRSLVRKKEILQKRKDQLEFGQWIIKQDMAVIECNHIHILKLPFCCMDGITSEDVFAYAKRYWDVEQIHMGIGSYISMEKVLENNFEVYDGIFTPEFHMEKDQYDYDELNGKYLCGCVKGGWENIPAMYQKMLTFAKENNFKLIGNAYEIGLNEFAISHIDDYLTLIMIKIKE